MDPHLDLGSLAHREAPSDIKGSDFRRLGHDLVDRIAEFLDSLPARAVTPGETPEALRTRLGTGRLPDHGASPDLLLKEAAELVFNHSLFNGHPRFWGYITSSAAPIGALADLLAATVNPNVGAWALSPAASEIEAQTIRWIAELIGYPTNCGGLLVSGGNVANFVGFLAGRRAKTPWDLRSQGISAGNQRLVVYVSKETHTWIEKAADLFGLGTTWVRWIPTNSRQEMDVDALGQQVRADRAGGHRPILVVGTAGTTATGAIDPLPEIAALCEEYELWFHVDGAYGAPAAALPEATPSLQGLRQADSIAIDPHKWLYSPLEAGCALVRDPQHLVQAFSYHPTYYNFDESLQDPGNNYYELGLQNSRGFRALKVWLGLRQVGRQGTIQMIRDDIALARVLYQAALTNPELEAGTQSLSITTFRFVPQDLSEAAPDREGHLDRLNRELLNRLQQGGEAFISNAVIDGKFFLRACVVNFRTTLADIESLPEIVTRLGRKLDNELRPEAAQPTSRKSMAQR